MNNKLLSLLGVQLKCMLGLSELSYNIKHDKIKLRKLLLFGFIIVMLIPSYILFFAVIDSILSVLAAVGEAGALLAIGAVGTCLMTFFFGLMYCFSTFFAAKDLEMLMVLPIKSENIVASKLICCIVYEYVFVLPLILPILIKYAAFTGAGLLFWLYALVLVLLMPVIPLSAAAVIEMLLMRASGMKANPEKVQTAFMYIFMALMLGFTFFTNRFAYSAGDDVSGFLSGKLSLFERISSSYPPALLFARSLENAAAVSGLIYLLAFAALSAAVFALAVFVGRKVYITALMNGMGAGGGKKIKYDKKMLAHDSIQGNKAMAVFKNDFRIMLRTPVFAMNTVFVVPLLPIVFVVSFAAMGAEQLQMIRMALASVGPIGGVFVMIFVLFFAGIFTTTSTTFSREGKGFWLNQVIPATAADQLFGRGLSALILNFFLFFFITVPLGVFCRWSFAYTALLTVCGTIASLPMIPMGLLIDATRPKLDWEDPAKAVKQNMNSIFCWLVSIAECIVIGGLTFLASAAGISTYLLLAAVTLLSVLLSCLLARRFIKKGTQLLMSE